ncbi:capsid cement protein [Adhaeretor mobilis]|uniref:Uncharacterized protein n=1 Tax=Adhaeretor mobilis TaxID=1930276 RepID=A0A517N288_9BACT|nr:hypothetical protein [Adhaeretor mobilis]QDT01270.1 hypothetical protein HG15A2_46120 [Adhaeretor mobilis]
MSNVMRWRYGDTNPVLLPAGESQVIEIGDLVYLSNGQAVAASELSDQGTKAANQEALHDDFVGVAMQASPSGDTTPVRIATSGVFEYPMLSATVELGELIGVAEDGLGTELLSQEVEAVATTNLAIGRCARQVNPAGERVLMDIVSTIMRGGVQGAA